MRVEILRIEGCPTWEVAAMHVREALETSGAGQAEVTIRRRPDSVVEHDRIRWRSAGMDLDGIALTTIDGRSTCLAEFAGQAKLVVNVASRCGFTPQYEKLEALQRRYGSRGFTVLGFPSNQFQQELDSEEAIAEYCSTTWGVTFPMFARAEVNGPRRHPLFAELAESTDGAGESGDVRWNFEKFFIDPAGEVVRFRSSMEPDDPEIIRRIEAAVRPGRRDEPVSASSRSDGRVVAEGR